jgi:hypothetical protein
MYKKSSRRTGGSSPYGWSGNYPKFRDDDKKTIYSMTLDEYNQKKREHSKKCKQFRGKRKPPSEEELAKMIEDFYKK